MADDLWKTVLPQLSIFWQRHPALRLGLALCFGILLAFGHLWVILPSLCLLRPTTFLIALMLILFYRPPTGDTFLVQTHSLAKAKYGGFTYRGAVAGFPCRFYHKQRLPLGRLRLHAQMDRKGAFVSLKKVTDVTVLKTSPLAMWRLSSKAKVHAYLTSKLHPDAAPFLSGLATGEFSDRTLLKSFGQLGLAHLLVISGFHFAILASLLHLVLRRKVGTALLIFFLTTYFLFIGPTPSIMRAWIAVTIALLGTLFEKEPTALNSLGLAMIVILILSPPSALTLSFQLSFLATAAILILCKPLDHLLQSLFPKKPLEEMQRASTLAQHRYVLCGLFRQALALTLAVHLALIPFLLATFHSFPLHSLAYNLIFPFLVTLSLLLLLLGFLFPPIHTLNSFYTRALLALIDSPPLPMKTLYVTSIPPSLLMLYLTALFLAGILFQNYLEKRQDGTHELQFRFL